MIFGISLFIVLMYLLVGALIGWIAGLIMKGKGFGFLGNIVIAILGSMVGGLVFNKILHLNVGSFFSAIGGAILLLFLIRLVSKKK